MVSNKRDSSERPSPTGLPKFNEQYQVFMTAINELDTAVRAGKARHEIETVIAYLKEYAERHFKFDEALFKSLEQLASTDLLTSGLSPTLGPTEKFGSGLMVI